MKDQNPRPKLPVAHDKHMPTGKLGNKALIALGGAMLGLAASNLDAATITGTVINKNTQKYLERATVQVVGTSTQVLTSRDGSFRLSDLPAGTYSIVVSYTDLDQMTKVVTVGETESSALNFELTSEEVYTLNQFVVTSPVEGTAYAVNQQRRAESTRSITSIDAFIDQTTGNPGEFLKNVEGIQMDYSQNEPQTIRVRGFDPNLTMVTMDGNKIASAASSSSSRAVQIDQLSIASIESVEVYKAPIPSMSANAIGGSVNFITKSAFSQKGRRAFAQVGVNMDSNDFTWEKSDGPGHGEKRERRIYPVGRVEYSNSFLSGRLGIVASAGYDHTNQLGSSTSHSVSVSALTGGTLPAIPTPYTLDNVTVRRGAFSMAPNRQIRVRGDISLNTDFKVNDELTVFLKSTYSDYHSSNRNHGFTMTPGTLASGATATSYTTTSGTTLLSSSVFDKYTKSWQLNPGLKYYTGDWKIDAVAGFSRSSNHYRNPDNFTSVGAKLNGTASWSMESSLETDVPTKITQISGPDIYDLASYIPNQTTLKSGSVMLANSSYLASTNKRDSISSDYSARADVQKDFHWRFPTYFKTGVSYNQTIYDKKQEQKRWYWAGDDGVIGTTDDDVGANFSRFAETTAVHQQIPGWNLKEPTYFSNYELWKYWQDHPQVLIENLAYTEQQKIAGRAKVDEQVRAMYFMGNTKISKLNILAGVRGERTDVDTRGYKVLATPTGMVANSIEAIRATYVPMRTRNRYTSDLFPYLHLRYEALKDLQFRASYTEAIGRPNLSDLVPNGLSINDDTDTITASNRAGLLPQRSKNVDVSVEYYTKSAGQISFGFFQRDVKKYISTVTTSMTPDLLEEFGLGSEYANYLVTTKSNLGNAKWYGYEASFRQSLRDWKFVPSMFSGFSFWANYTKIAKMEGDYGTPGASITKLANVVPELINGGVSFLAPNGKFFIQLSTNYQAKKPTANLPATGTSGQMDSYQEPYQFWNMEAYYKLTDKWKISCTGRNLFSERAKFSDMGIIKNTQQATGIAWLFAVRHDF